MKQHQSDIKDGRREDRERGEQDGNVERHPVSPDRRGEERAASPAGSARDAMHGDEPGYGYGV